MSDRKVKYNVTVTNGNPAVTIEEPAPERELAQGIRRLLLSAAKLIEIYIERKWG